MNDTYGHKARDLVIIGIADIIRENVKDVDTVARWGGEEFIAVLPYSNKDQGLIVAQRILERVSAHKFEQFTDRCITVSIGVSYLSPSLETKEKLIEAADSALYEAKRKGRNRIECCTL